MARKPPTPTPPAPKKELDLRELELGIERIKERIQALNSFDPSLMTVNEPPEIEALEISIQRTLTRIFGEGTADLRLYENAWSLQWRAGVYTDDYPQLFHYQQGIRDNIARSKALLEQAIYALEEEIKDLRILGRPPSPSKTRASSDFRQVFVVHGHDGEARETVARFLVENLDLKPVILHEQPNQGRTVIEKVEDHGDVAFAVVLLTPDDVGGPKDGAQQPRPRQNVLLELGYFIGRLGRKRVCALKRGEMELPTDFAGIVWESFDEAGGWKQKLGRELQAAGFDIDWNKVMRR